VVSDRVLFACNTVLNSRAFWCLFCCLSQATLYQGSVYLTTSEFFGSGSNRVPSVYWAVIEPGTLATGGITVQGSGVIASQDGLALAFPVIAALNNGEGAVIAYSYSKSGEVASIGKAYAGAWTELPSSERRIAIATIPCSCASLHH
jgi:hypothetical protein